MARTAWSTSNFMRYASGLLTAQPLTMAGWVNISNPTVNQAWIGLYNSAGTGNVNQFILGCSTTAYFAACDGSTGTFANTSTSVPTSTWAHVCGVASSPSSRAVYLNGGGKGTAAVSRVPSGINRLSIGKRDNVSNDVPLASGSLIAEFGLWNIALSDSDVTSLAKGASPLLVHPEALVGYWPLLGRYSPEINLKSNTSVLGINGTLSQAAHPRIFMPPKSRLIL